tara:strand:- start:203 stop:397 length:195 start_codon:yes stop_codon:yes gene_type:complete
VLDNDSKRWVAGHFPNGSVLSKPVNFASKWIKGCIENAADYVEKKCIVYIEWFIQKWDPYTQQK